jgi:hypothetical protein
MQRSFKILAASFFSIVLASHADAAMIVGTGSGLFTFNLNSCSGCTGNNSNTIGFGGFNASTITSNNTVINTLSAANDVPIMTLTWVNRETFGGTTENKAFTYKYTLAFTSPSPGASDSESFTLTFNQPVNPQGDRVTGLNLILGAGSNALSSTIDGLTLSDFKFHLQSPVGPGESYSNGTWLNSEDNTSVLVLTADIAVAAVPESSTWVMMVLGFAGVAFMIHRRRSGCKLRSWASVASDFWLTEMGAHCG